MIFLRFCLFRGPTLSLSGPDPSHMLNVVKPCPFPNRRACSISLALKSSSSAVSHSRHCLLCPTADMSAVSHNRHVCCITAHTSAVSHSRHVCPVIQQSCLLRHMADMAAVSHSGPSVSHSRHIRFVPKQTCLLCHAADTSAVSRQADPQKEITVFGLPRTAKLCLLANNAKLAHAVPRVRCL